MSYTASQLSALYQRSVDLYGITPLGEVASVAYLGQAADSETLVYLAHKSNGDDVPVYVLIDPESGEALATNDV